MKEYKNLLYSDTQTGRKHMEADLNAYAKKGWILKDTQYLQHSTNFTRSHPLGRWSASLLSTASQGDQIQVILEREATDEAKRLDEQYPDPGAIDDGIHPVTTMKIDKSFVKIVFIGFVLMFVLAVALAVVLPSDKKDSSTTVNRPLPTVTTTTSP